MPDGDSLVLQSMATSGRKRTLHTALPSVYGSLCEVLNLRPGMRVLDLGSRWALGSVFMAPKFGVEV